MPANNTCWLVHYWQGLYGGLGHLYTPERREVGYPHIPFAIDCGTFGYASRGEMDRWSPDRFRSCLDWATTQINPPRWVIVPDVPFDWSATVERWTEWADEVRGYGWPVAIAVQNGAEPEEVKGLNPDVVFVGGDTEWKWATAATWCREFPRVHVGRVNSPKRLYQLHELGCESCDGTGWFRGKVPQIQGLEEFLAWQSDPQRVTQMVAAMSRKGRTKGVQQGELW
ncbi:MAG: hypothetical protein ACO1SV_21735 [Fimbriimonas sp.]